MSGCYRLRLLGAGLCSLLWLAVPGRVGALDLPVAPPDPTQVVVIANRALPESIKLARYYAEKRGIPFGNICLLDLPPGERISRSQYERQLRDPLLEFLRRRQLIRQRKAPKEELKSHDSGWRTEHSDIRYLVSMYGVPVAVEEDGGKPADYHTRTGAAVDSELCLVLGQPYDPAGAVNCPIFNHLEPPDPKKTSWFLPAVRLDGPDEETVRSMIDGALYAEQYGLGGVACFDLRGTEEKGYVLGDYWLEESAERWAREGYEVITEQTPAVWSEAAPLEHMAVYFGWYRPEISGPFARDGFRFRPGAIAVHIHSSSAVSLRTRTRYWVGPLLARGAAAALGAVSEPYLATMPWLHILSDRLCRGFCWADAVYMAMPAVSWQVTVVGDPLYRPFRHDLAVQLRHLQEAGEDFSWVILRRINSMVRQGMFNPALDLCRQAIKETHSPILQEKLADLYAMNGLVRDAAAEYRQVIERATSAETAVRCTVKLLGLAPLEMDLGERKQLLEAIRQRWAGHEVTKWLERVKP